MDEEKGLRDAFAAAALEGLLAGVISSPNIPDWMGNDPAKSYAKRSYEYADAMLAERKKSELNDKE